MTEKHREGARKGAYDRLAGNPPAAHGEHDGRGREGRVPLRLAQGLRPDAALRGPGGLRAEVLSVKVVQPEMPGLPRGGLRQALDKRCRLTINKFDTHP